jgi:hypothetical protein
VCQKSTIIIVLGSPKINKIDYFIVNMFQWRKPLVCELMGIQVRRAINRPAKDQRPINRAVKAGFTQPGRTPCAPTRPVSPPNEKHPMNMTSVTFPPTQIAI